MKHEITFRDSKKSFFDDTNKIIKKMTISEAQQYAFKNDLFISLVDGRPNPYHEFKYGTYIKG